MIFEMKIPVVTANIFLLNIIQSFSEKLYDVGEKLELNRQWNLYRHTESGIRTIADRYGNDLYPNYGHAFDEPFYIGLTHNIVDESGKNQWKWASTDRMLSKNTLGERGDWEGEERWKKNWKLISWAKEANGNKLRGNCTFVTNEAELWEIKCSTKLTIVCEESF